MPELAAAPEKMEKLRENYQDKLPHEIRHIKSLWEKLLYVKWDPNVFSLLHRLVHNLAGTAGTYGYTEISSFAGKLDRQLQVLEQTHEPPSEHERSRISGRIQRLEEILNSTKQLEMLEPGAIPAPAPESRPARQTCVLVLEDDPDQCIDYTPAP